jgi:hypothetical protein
VFDFITVVNVLDVGNASFAVRTPIMIAR